MNARKKQFKLVRPDDCHGCAYYNVYSDYCTRRGLICRFLSLEDAYKKGDRK